MSCHVLVIYNEPILPPEHPDAASEHEIVKIAGLVAEELGQAGCRASQLGLQHDPAPLVERLCRDRPDAVFNLFEGFSDGRPAEIYPLAILDWLQIPYTGNGVEALTLCRDKARAKYMLRGAGLPTPRFCVAAEVQTIPRLDFPWPAIVKPVSQDASLGIDQDSVVVDDAALRRQVGKLIDRYHLPVLIEEFIAGREFNLGIITRPKPEVLPIAEIVFGFQETGRWPILTYEAKWAEGSLEDLATRPCCPAAVEPALAEELRSQALAAFALFGCRDFVRVDFRVDAAGRPFILEVNPNPGYHPTAGFSRMLQAAGMSHAEYSLSMVRRALEREGR